MIPSAITVSLVAQTRNSGPFVFQDDLLGACRAAGALGFDAMEVFACGGKDPAAASLKSMLADHNLRLAAVGTGAGWLLHRLTLSAPDAAVRQQGIDFVRGVIDLGGPLKAPAIVGSMQGRADRPADREAALEYLADSLRQLCDHAAAYNLPLLIEPLNRYETNLLNSLADGVRLVKRSHKPNLKLLADLFHMNIEEVDSPAALKEAAEDVGHVHLADSNRRPAGLGHTEFGPIADALRAIGYSGYVSAEALPHPDPERAAEQTIACYRKYFQTVSD